MPRPEQTPRSAALRLTALFALLLTGCNGPANAPGEPVRIAAAASLQRPVETLVERFRAERPGVDLRVAPGASGALRRKIAQGAPYHLFLSADPLEVERLAGSGRLHPGSQADFLANTLVLATGRPAGEAPAGWSELAEGSWSGRLALGEIHTAPVGRYARSTLEHLQLWTPMADRLVFGKNALQVARYLETGEVEAGILYRSDLHDRELRLITEAPPGSHASIRYRLSLLVREPGEAPHPEAEAFARYLRGTEAARVFAAYGFEPLPE